MWHYQGISSTGAATKPDPNSSTGNELQDTSELLQSRELSGTHPSTYGGVIETWSWPWCMHAGGVPYGYLWPRHPEEPCHRIA